MIDIDTLARAYDPAAFEHHPIEERSHVAAIQWAARRKLATEAAERALPKIPVPSGALGALVAERDALRAQLDNMTIEWGSTYVADDESDTPVFEAQNEADARRHTEGRATTGSFAFHTVKRQVGPWTAVEGGDRG